MLKPVFYSVCLLLCAFSSLNAQQNLVPNGDFEYYSNCPTNLSQTANCTGWAFFTNGTSDYFNSCFISNFISSFIFSNTKLVCINRWINCRNNLLFNFYKVKYVSKLYLYSNPNFSCCNLFIKVFRSIIFKICK